jgi:glycosyltransferase involved in cell wall biosynthesis
LKILVSAWACNPREGSEAAVGWAWLAAIKERNEVHVLTARYQRYWIEAEIGKQPEQFSHVRFHYVEPRLQRYDSRSRFWKWQAGVPILVPLFHRYYRGWMGAAYKAARDLHRRLHFDLVHQLTFVGFRFPGHLWKLDAPFVWGPIGGLEDTPWRLLPAMGVRGAAYYAGRNIVNSVHKRFLRGPRKAFRRADAVIAATSGIQAEILKWYRVPSEVICEVSTPFRPAADFRLRAPGEPLRIAWSGHHMPGKALPILLRALSATAVNWHLDIYGDGPCRRKWRRLASRLDVASGCTWHGRVWRDEAIRGLRRAHLLVITSLKDLTSTVTVEALASGVPVVCPDHCGFADVVTRECGVKLPIGTPGEFERALADTIAELAGNEARRRRLAAGALERARDFSWEHKAEAIERVYREALKRHHARALFPSPNRERQAASLAAR